MRIRMLGILSCAACLVSPLMVNAGSPDQYSLGQVLHYPYDSQLASAQGADINEIHGFLRHATWLRVDQATVAFLARNLRVPGLQN